MSVTVERETYVLIDTTHSKRCGLFCNLCEIVLITKEDNESFANYECCHDCFLRFVEARKEEYVQGWRPLPKDINNALAEKIRIFIS